MDTDELLTTAEIFAAFAEAGQVLPAEALRQAAERWPEIGPALLDLLQEAADTGSIAERTGDILFYAIFLMAQQRDGRALLPLCALARRGDALHDIIGDAITENLEFIFVRLYGGDPAPLRDLVEGQEADAFVRAAALEALVSLTLTGVLDRDDMAAYLEGLFAQHQPKADAYIWIAWQNAIAALGLAHLTPLVKAAYDRRMIDETFTDFDEFLEYLADASDPGKQADQMGHLASGVDELDNVIFLFSTWHYFSPDYAAEKEDEAYGYPALDAVHPAFGENLRGMIAQDPVRNPLRNVGRNDPCPCGSGKKFKKCCLGKT